MSRASPENVSDPHDIPHGVNCSPSSIWLIDREHERAVPLTDGKMHSIGAIWSPDGTRIAFNGYSTTYSAVRAEPVWMLPTPGSPVHPVLARDSTKRRRSASLSDWTRSAGLLAFRSDAASGKPNDQLVQFGIDDSVTTPILESSSNDRLPALSPDGHWLAYQSNLSGATEVYVRAFPAGGTSVLISSRGGVESRWSANGSELYYRSGTRIMVAAVQPGASFALRGTPQQLFSGPYDFSQDRNWSPSPDGTFIMVKGDPAMGRQLRVVFNWFDELTATGKK